MYELAARDKLLFWLLYEKESREEYKVKLCKSLFWVFVATSMLQLINFKSFKFGSRQESQDKDIFFKRARNKRDSSKANVSGWWHDVIWGITIYLVATIQHQILQVDAIIKDQVQVLVFYMSSSRKILQRQTLDDITRYLNHLRVSKRRGHQWHKISIWVCDW